MKEDIVHLVQETLKENPFKYAETYHLIKKSLTRFCKMVVPIEVPFGKINKVDKRRNVITEKTIMAQVVPLKESLAQILSNEELASYIFELKLSDPHYYETVRDGSLFKNNEVCKKYPNSLLIQLYEDDIEVVNPLGSHVKTHKLLNVYFTLLNFPESVRSNLKSISLVAIAKSTHVKEFGIEPCLNDFIETIIQLESDEGLTININGVDYHLHGTLLSVAGDSLALNGLGGFKESFGFALRPCRMCMLPKEDMSQIFTEFGMPLRSKTMHDEHLSILESAVTLQDRTVKSTEFGVVNKSVLCKIKSFDVTKMLTMDLMHNLLEGVCDVEMKAILYHLIEELHLLTYKQLNILIDTFPYPPELAKNKPSVIEKHHVKDGQLRQCAGQTITLMIVLPLILAPFVTAENEKYENFVLLAQLTQVLLAYKIKKSSIDMLRHMIFEHHSNFKKLYPTIAITPKFHFLVHSPSVIEQHGPARIYWCMRYESRHAWFGRVAAESNNWKNMPKTMASRFQILRTLDLDFGTAGACVLGQKSFLAVSCIKLDLDQIPLSQPILEILNCPNECHLNSAEILYLENFEYKKGSVILLHDDVHELPFFGQISSLFVKEKMLYFGKCSRNYHVRLQSKRIHCEANKQFFVYFLR